MKKYKCLFCLQEFGKSTERDGHIAEVHDVLYLPVLREELVKLMRYIQLSDIVIPGTTTKGDLVDPILFKRMRQLSNNITE